MSEIEIRPITPADAHWVCEILTAHWDTPTIISRGQSQDAGKLPGFSAQYAGERVGLITYRIAGQDCELVTVNSWRENIGVGSHLIAAVRHAANAAGCARLWLSTTNDNLHALGFYQKRGFQIAAIYPNAMAAYRKIKPAIPEIGLNGIPLRDEIELEMLLQF